MPQSPPSRAAFLLALRLAGHADALVSGQDIQEYYPQSGVELLAAGALIRAQPLTTFLIEGKNGEREVDLEWHEGFGSYAYFTVWGWKRVPPEYLARYRLRFAWLPETLGQSLGLDHKPVELIPAVCWELGTIILRKRRVQLYFARQAQASSVAIMDALHRRQGAHAIVLLADDIVTASQRQGTACLPVLDILDAFCPAVSLRLDMIANAAFGQLPPTVRQALKCLEDGHLLILHGREFRFRGDKQASAVKFLADAFHNDEPSVRVASLLEAVGASITIRKLSQLFRGHPDWQDAIGTSAGRCWLKTDT